MREKLKIWAGFFATGLVSSDTQLFPNEYIICYGERQRASGQTLWLWVPETLAEKNARLI